MSAKDNTIRESHTLMFALFETMLKQQRKLGYRGDDDSEYQRQDRLASEADNVIKLRREQE